ncbi:MAG: GTPase ObgE, partial [Gammaproteobacteria bacterium]|nr:GTPase ObgE [Gammaproteobacteria bacterium]
IPGLIEGASTGAGLGIQFLKHLSRTRLLLHIIDIATYPEVEQIMEQIDVIENELSEFEVKLSELPRWLVLNKTDCLDESKVAELKSIIMKQKADMSCYCISAISGNGCDELVFKIMQWINSISAPEKNDE